MRIITSFLLVLLLVTSAHAEKISTKLSDFYVGESIVQLRGIQSEVQLSVPLSTSVDIVEATIELDINNSIALIQNRSILNVRFNNATIGQIALSPERPRQRASVRIPESLWRNGFNALTLAVGQHYAEQCETGIAPELWTEVNLYNSTLSVTTARRSTAPTLRALSSFFNPGLGGQRLVTIVTAEEASSTIKDKALPLVAQGLALRNQYQPLLVKHNHISSDAFEGALGSVQERLLSWWADEGLLIDDADLRKRLLATSWYEDAVANAIHVVVGKAGTLETLVAFDTEIKGPHLFVETTPALTIENQVIVPSHTRLIVSGVSDDDVLAAAALLAVMDDELNPGVDATLVSNKLSVDVDTKKRPILQSGTSYSFSELGSGSVQFRGENQFYHAVTASLPADFYVNESATFAIDLDFAYGSGFGVGSVMNVLLNNKLVHGLTLSNPNGQSFKNYRLNVPARTLRGGKNLITFDLAMRAPLAGVPCDEVGGNHLLFQLFDSSSIDIPSAGAVAVQPNLKLFSETGFPFVAMNRDTSNIYISDEALRSSALTLVGKLAQVHGTPLSNVVVTTQSYDKATTGDIVLSTLDTDARISQHAISLTLGETHQWPYRLQNHLHNIVRNDEKESSSLRVPETTEQISDIGSMAVLLAAPEQVDTNLPGASLQIVTKTPSLMDDRLSDLISLSLWGQLAGDTFVWDSAEQPLLAMQIHSKYVVGEARSTWLTIRLWLTNHPWYWLVMVVAFCLLLAVIVYRMTQRRYRAVSEQWN